MKTLTDIALDYARKGLHVIPVAFSDKRPIVPNWTKECSVEKDKIKEWFDGEDLNVGIVTGKVSNIVVIDIDTHDNTDGRKSVAEWEASTGSYLPPTVTAKTQSGGIHLFFRYPSGVDKITGKVGILENVDIRGDGNQVVVYPSVGEKGEYTWVIPPWEKSFAPLPKAWRDFILGENTSDKIKIPKRAFKLPDSIPSGIRHSTLLSYACSLGNKSMSEVEISGAVREANRKLCNPPVTDEIELVNIINWAIDKTTVPQEVDTDGLPEWVAIDAKGRQSVDEASFVGHYKKEHDLLCINGVFYNDDGVVDTNYIKNDIQTLVADYVDTSLSGKVNSLLDSLRNECYFKPPAPSHDVVNLTNTSLQIDETGIYEIEMGFTLNRLGVEYDAEARSPMWIKFLNQLLEPDDVRTLQEFLGYCLVPTTIAQKAMFIVGKGGEGKSVVGEVAQALFNMSMVQGELHKIQDNRFMLAQLENKLVFYDDDLQSSALSDTGLFKKLVTATIPVLVERKGEPHYEMLPYARILASGNKGIESCYDHSEGFYRRLIILQCKEKHSSRKDDKLLAKRIIKNELSGILNWSLEGLQRLMSQEWIFNISEKSQKALTKAEEDGNTFLAFLRDEEAVVFDEDEEVTSADLYLGYTRWCEDNALKPVAKRTVGTHMRESAESMGLEYSNRVQGKRGYVGIGIKREVKKIGKYVRIPAKEA